MKINKLYKMYRLFQAVERECKMNPKKWFASKTLWVNAIGLVIMLVDHFAGIKAIPADVAAAALAVLNMLLRIVTSKPVTA